MTTLRSSFMRHLAWSVTALATVLLAGGCATSDAQRPDTPPNQQRAAEPRPTPAVKVAADPRPIGVPDNATPEERGREILRVVIELIKHGELRDTEFASRLLGIPIGKDQAIGWIDSDKFPQQLTISFGYEARPHMRIHAVRFGLNRARTCLLLDDLLHFFHREFGVGVQLVPDAVQRKLVAIPLERGWARATLDMDAHPSALRLYRNLNNGMSVGVSGSSQVQCLPNIDIQQFRSTQQSR